MMIEMQQHELDTEEFTETCGELRARINRIIADDRLAGEVSSAKSQMPRSLQQNCNASAPRLNCPPLISQNLDVNRFQKFP
jgi:hypothetical protein